MATETQPAADVLALFAKFQAAATQTSAPEVEKKHLSLSVPQPLYDAMVAKQEEWKETHPSVAAMVMRIVAEAIGFTDEDVMAAATGKRKYATDEARKQAAKTDRENKAEVFALAKQLSRVVEIDSLKAYLMAQDAADSDATK